MALFGTFNYGGGRPYPNPTKYGYGPTYPAIRPEYSLGKFKTSDGTFLGAIIYTYGGLVSEEILGYAISINPRGNVLQKTKDDTILTNDSELQLLHLLPSQKNAALGSQSSLIETLSATDRVIKNIGKVQTIPQAGNRFMR